MSSQNIANISLATIVYLSKVVYLDYLSKLAIDLP